MEHRLTKRSFIAGYFLAVVLCAVNSYLTLSFGIMEEGPAIAALIFFAMYFRSTNKITTSEMAIVATMGSAGGSLGFISNFFAAQVMVATSQGGEPYTIWDMTVFGAVTSLIGLVSVVFLRQILIIKDAELPENQRLPWVGAKAVKGMIDPLVSGGDPMQPRYLAFFSIAAITYILFNADGIGWFPSYGMIAIAGLATYGAGIAFSPFVWGGAYLMGFRTCVGFLTAGIALLIMAPHLPNPSAPHTYIWPGIMFLVTSGITALAVNWRVIVDAMKSLFQFKGGTDSDPIMSKNGLILFTVLSLVVTTLFLYFQFELGLMVIIAMVVVGGLVLNVIATRAAAQTYFNPARVMGILLMGVNTLLGASNSSASLTGAGFIAGSGAQGGNLTNDMAYGFWYRLKSSWQFWTQAATVLACSFVAALTFYLIRTSFALELEGGDGLAAPIGKIWATMALLFDPNSTIELPPFAVESMWIAGIAGVVWGYLETKQTLRRFLPCSIGFGLGLILPIVYNFGFFAGGVLMWYLLRRFLKIKDITLNTLAISCIVGEGIGGILQAVLKMVGLI